MKIFLTLNRKKFKEQDKVSNHASSQLGLTFIEVLFVSLTFAMILLTVSLAFRGSFNSWLAGNRRSEIIQIARVGLHMISREIRSAHNFGNLCDDQNLYYTDSNGVFKQFRINRNSKVLQYGTVGALSDLVYPIEPASTFLYYRIDGVTQTTRPSEIRSVRVILVVSDLEGNVKTITASMRVKRRMENTWPKYHKDVQSLGVTNELLNPALLSLRWNASSFPAGCNFQDSSPVVSDDGVFIGGCSNGDFYKLDAATGASSGGSAWSVNLGGAINSAAALDDNNVYIARGSTVYAFRKQDGVQAWAPASLDSYVSVDHSSPVVYGDSVYVALGNATLSYVYRLNTLTGARIWRSMPFYGNVNNSTLSILESAIYIGAGQRIYAIDLRDGSILWPVTPLGSGFIRYVANSRVDQNPFRELNIQVINTSNVNVTVSSLTATYSGGATYKRIQWAGSQVWRRDPPQSGNSSGQIANFDPKPTIGPGQTANVQIQQFSSAVNLVSFTITLSDGSSFVVPVLGQVMGTNGYGNGLSFETTPSIFGNSVYAGCDDLYVYAFNRRTGAMLWRVRRSNQSIKGPPAVSVDGLYIYVGAGTSFYKLATSNGSSAWPSPSNLNQPIWSTPALSGSNIFINAGQNLYVINDVDGSIIRTIPLSVGTTQYSSPAIVNGVVYIGKSNGVEAYGIQ